VRAVARAPGKAPKRGCARFLIVWAPQAEYMLAMKCISARFDSQDLDDANQISGMENIFIFCGNEPSSML
jgi:hypothetical protein